MANWNRPNIPARGQRPTLSQGLDREIYQVVRKLADEQAQLEGGGKKLIVSTVYDSIKNSNSSLRRRSKKLLEDSIERVLLVIREEEDDSESMDGDFDGIEEAAPVLKVSSEAIHGMGHGIFTTVRSTIS